MTQILCAELEGILQKEYGLQKELEEILQAEQAALTSCQTEEISRIAAQKETAAMQMRMHEEARLDVTDRLAKATGLPEGKARLSELCRRVDPADRKRLEHLGKSLMRLEKENQELNRLNLRLVEEGLDLVQRTVKAVVGAVQKGSTYGESNGKKPSRSRSWVVQHQV